MKVKDIVNYLDTVCPFENKCEWDNCGLLIGDVEREVKKIGFTLDLTKETLLDAIKNDVDLIVTHHPVIFHAQKNFLSGNIAYDAAFNRISVISCHTCYDSADGGVSDILAERIGLSDIEVFETKEKPSCVRKGSISGISPDDFAKSVSSSLGTTVRFVRGKSDIKTVAVCGGGGGDFVDEVILSGADAYVTGDISHHQFLSALDSGLTLIAAGHFETEDISVSPLMNKVGEAFPEAVCVRLTQHNPVEFVKNED